MIKDTYKICNILHIITELDVRFLGVADTESLQLTRNSLHERLETIMQETFKEIVQIMEEHAEDEYLFYTDNLRLCYLAVGKRDCKKYEGSIIVGPFLFDIPDETFISKVIENNRLPLSLKLRLLNFYKTLSIIEYDKCRYMGNLLVNLTMNPYKNGHRIFMESSISKHEKTAKYAPESREYHSKIEMKYILQSKLCKYVEKGLKEKALEIQRNMNFDIYSRMPENPLRTSKNLSISLNTLLRVAATSAVIHPVYIHNISDKYSVLIEKTKNLSELENLNFNMVSEYCDMVKNQSVAEFSPTIRNAINVINLNFSSRLTLKQIADDVQVNPSHLSRQFKKETGVTITEYINKKRIEEAKSLIKQGNHSIMEIALMVGFENHNYFSSVFKKITSYTPSEFLKKENKL